MKAREARAALREEGSTYVKGYGWYDTPKGYSGWHKDTRENYPFLGRNAVDALDTMMELNERDCG